MNISRGKEFESVVRKAFETVDNLSVDRFPDPMRGFLGVRNICDFGLYKKPYQYYFECKTTHGNTLHFSSAISKNQLHGLLEKSNIEGVVAGILVWFIAHDITAFVPIQEIKKQIDAGKKSLNVKDLKNQEINFIELRGKKKRVFFDYDMNKFFGMLAVAYSDGRIF